MSKKPATDVPEWCPPLLADWLEEVEDEPQWLIENFLPEEGMTLVSGHQKLTRKSFTAFAATLAVATGKVIGPFKATRAGHVVYIEEEGTKAPTKKRWEAFIRAYGLKKNKVDCRFAFRAGIGLDTEVWRKRLLEYVDYFEPALIVFDNLSFMHSGDENSNNDMRAVVSTLQLIRNAGTATLFLAHLSKSAGSDPKEDIDKQVRGGSIVVNGYDVHWALRNYVGEHAPIDLIVRYRDLGGRQFTVDWKMKHQKDSELLDEVTLAMRERYDEWDPRFSIECLAQLERGKAYGVEDLKRVWKSSRKAAQEVVDRLVAAKSIKHNKQTGRYEVL